MDLIPSRRPRRYSLKHKLAGYMALLTALLAAALCAGLGLSGSFTSPRAETYSALTAQMEFFRDDMRTLWRNISVKGVKLSEEMTELLESELSGQGLSFGDLNENIDAIRRVEDAMLDPLCQYVRQADCSGAFVILEVRMTPDGAQDQRAGLYVQKNNAEKLTNELLLYRGLAGVGKAHGVMPHRKWGREFSTDSFPDYAGRIADAALPLSDACRSSNLATLPGTSEKAMFLTVPLIGSDGTVYGLCGFSVNQTYFSGQHGQPSNLRSLACVMTSGTMDGLDASAALMTYTNGGFFQVAETHLEEKKMDSGLSFFSSDGDSYVGITEPFTAASGDSSPHTLAVLIPRAEYTHATLSRLASILLLAVLLTVFAVACCLYASRRYLRPVQEDITHLHLPGRGREQMHFPEFESLSLSLHTEDTAHSALVSTLQTEKAAAREQAQRLLDAQRDLQLQFTEARDQLEKARDDVKELSKGQIDPEVYHAFLIGYDSLNPAERAVFASMLEGHSAQQTADLRGSKRSTIYSHHKKIYEKLGGRDLDLFRRCVALMQQEQEEEEKASP